MIIKNMPFAALLGLSSVLLFGGCATIVKDDSQPVAFSSEPEGATVKINDIPRGKTPTTIMVKRDFGKQMVGFDLEGYHPLIFPMEKSVAGMTFGNIIFGGVIGVGVDIATGKATNYDDAIRVIMTPLSEPKPALGSGVSKPEQYATDELQSNKRSIGPR